MNLIYNTKVFPILFSSKNSQKVNDLEYKIYRKFQSRYPVDLSFGAQILCQKYFEIHKNVKIAKSE